MTELRDCVGLEVPTGPEAIDVLAAALTEALAGRGPAIALLPGTADTGYAQRLRAAVRPGEPVPAEVVVVAATSGSTGDPAGVLIPGSALLAAADGFAQLVSTGSADTNPTSDTATGPPGVDGSGLDKLDRRGPPWSRQVGQAWAGTGSTGERRHRWVAALPLHHAGGFMVVVRAIVGGSLPVGVAGAEGARFTVDQLGAATQTAADLSATDGRPLAISLVPAQLAALHDAGKAGLDLLRQYDVVLVGGAAAPASLLATLRTEGVQLRTSYGMTETCGGAVFDGTPLSGTTVTVDSAGRLRIEGGQVALGYRDGRQPERWTRGPQGIRRFLTDDLGTVAPDGTVTVTGRRDDVVQVGGASVAMGAVADVLAADPSVREVEVVAVEDPRLGTALVAFVVPSRGACAAGQGAEGQPDRAGSRPRLADRLTDRVVEALGRSARPRRIVLVGALPLAGTGKRDRAALLDRARITLSDPGP